MYPLEEPLHGEWPFADYPDMVEIDGTLYVKAIRTQPYSGVVAQYREPVARDSAHLLVLEDGNWIVDHIDGYNPDMGRPVRHFFRDHPAGRLLVMTGTGIGMLAIAITRGKRENK